MEVCPIEAVDLSTYATDVVACIKYMACVKSCPNEAKMVKYTPQVSEFMNIW